MTIKEFGKLVNKYGITLAQCGANWFEATVLYKERCNLCRKNTAAQKVIENESTWLRELDV